MKYPIYMLIVVLLLGNTSCEKFLDEKPDQSLAVPSRLQDLQALLDYETWMVNSNLAAGDIASDYYYVNYADWSPRQPRYREAYVWDGQADVFDDWTVGYTMVFYANLVLEQVEKVDLGGMTESDRIRIKGSALFYRAWAYSQLLQEYAPAYDAQTADEQLGIVLKERSDLGEELHRANLAACYQQVIDDLSASLDLLPDKPSVLSRPSRSSSLGLLSRVYLMMGNYTKSAEYGEQALNITDKLIDYNTLDSTLTNPFDVFNEEVVLHAKVSITSGLLTRSRAKAATDLMALFEEDDLRPAMNYFKNADGSYGFKGNLCGGNVLFAGISTGEIYLNTAESLLRSGNIPKALVLLNNLRIKRFKAGQYKIIEEENEEDLLKIVLEERQRELSFRIGIRWGDLKRLNLDSRFSKVLKRSMDNEDYELPPNDLRYAFLIPFDVVSKSHVQQNPR